MQRLPTQRDRLLPAFMAMCKLVIMTFVLESRKVEGACLTRRRVARGVDKLDVYP